MRATTDEIRLCTAWWRGGGNPAAACAEVLRSTLPGLRRPLRQNILWLVPGLAGAPAIAAIALFRSRHFSPASRTMPECCA